MAKTKSKSRGKASDKGGAVKKYSWTDKLYQVKDRLSVKDKKPFLETELAVDEGAIYKRLKLVPYMPDELLTKKKIDVLNRMLLDPEIESTVDELKLIRLSSGWEIEAASDSERDKMIRDFVEWNLENIEGSFDDDLREIMGGVELGASLNEIVWEIIQYKKYKGKIGVRNIKSKNPKYFNLWTDDFDNLLPNGIVNISTVDYGKQYPIDKFIIYSFNKRYENIWGISRIRALYDLWYIKQVITRAMGIYIEKFGHPFPVFKTVGEPDAGTRQYLLNILKQIRYETGFILPEGVEYQIAEASKGSSDVYLATLNYINQQIRKKVLGQTLGDDSSSGGHAYASDKVKFDILLFYEEHLGADVGEKAVNQQLIKRLVDYNFTDVEEYPHFRFKPLVQEDTEKMFNAYVKGVDAKVFKPTSEDEEIWRERFKLPARDVDTAPSQVVLDAKTPKPPEDTPAPAVNSSEFSEINIYADKIFTGVMRRKYTKYEEQTDFIEIVQTSKSIEERYVMSASKMVRGGIEDMIRAIQRNQIIENKDFNSIKSLSFMATGDLKDLFNQCLVDTFGYAQRGARQEIIKKKRSSGKYSEGAIFKFQYDIDLRKINPQEALAWFDAQSFSMAGVEKTSIENNIKQILYNAIKTGATLRDTVNEIQDSASKYYDVAEAGDETYKGYRLETVIRTNTTAAMNEGRKMFFESPELEGYVVAYQYSAILDDRVRPNHACMDSKIYSTTSPVWDNHTPPMGYNCRCLLIPVSAQEGYEESSAPPKSCDPDEGFGAPGQ
jgi:SPP1 gp7 family putative phage head morphogenesis protein